MPSRIRLGMIVLIGFGALFGLWRRRNETLLDSAAALAVEEIAAGRHDVARDLLEPVAKARPDDPQVAYDLGYCLLRLGDERAAFDAWRRIPPGTELASRAAVDRARLLLDRGRLSESEDELTEALATARNGPESAMIRELLTVLYRLEGRTAEIRPRVESVWRMVGSGTGPRWSETSTPRDLLRQYAAVDLEPEPSERLSTSLREAGRKAPDDDRVALGLANLAIRGGFLDEADRLLVGCERKRPSDPAVLRARHDWAVAFGDFERAATVLAKLPEGSLTPAEALRFSARLAGRRGDERAEKTLLERLVALEPGRGEALERLAELALARSDKAEATRLRSKKAEIDRLTDRYRAIYFHADVAAQGAEAAGLAEALGRRFEAEAWWTLLSRARPGDPTPRERLRSLSATGPEAPLKIEAPRGTATTEHSRIASPGAILFKDAASDWNLTFRFDNGETPERRLPETMGGGVGLIDFDGDGLLDVYLVQGGSRLGATAEAPGDRLFRNAGKSFTDVTATAGLPATYASFGNGVAVGDHDGDGDADLFVTRLDSYKLYRNDRGRFVDVTESAGLGGTRDWPTSAAFLDMDSDGDLDLYVCHYARWDDRAPLVCKRPDGSPSYCPPRAVEPTQDRLFRNDGGRFTDVTAGSAIDGEKGRGLGVLAADLDGDRKTDLYVANDGSANYFLWNRGNGRFEEIGVASGVASNSSGGYQAGMGVACGDVDGDGRLDLAVTNFFGESTSLFGNVGGGFFVDRAAASGLAIATRSLLGFGTALFDGDNDGDLDLLTMNGHVVDGRPDFPHRMPAGLLAGDGRGRLIDVSTRSGDVFETPRLGRGLAVGDLDDDGRLDAVAIDQNRPAVLFHNRSEGGRWIRFRLKGTRSNRDGVGATVSVIAKGKRLVSGRFGGGSYQSASDGRVHFGLGNVERVDSVEVAWPSGATDRFRGLETNSDYLIREGDADPVTWKPTPR